MTIKQEKMDLKELISGNQKLEIYLLSLGLFEKIIFYIYFINYIDLYSFNYLIFLS